ncbi:DNA-directed RNA polymerase subunit B [Candidatus Woesearchaeota archaeon]|nr:DNA-directed RNA polymerase subunit B [Candidatus Woesearchaeota archaeon]
MNKNQIIIQKYFEENMLVESDIESFNYFIEEELQKIIEENQDIEPTIIPHNIEEYKIRFDKIIVKKPEITEADGSVRTLYPNEARIRKISYSAPVIMEVSAHVDGIQRESYKIQVASLPIMLKSKQCHLHGLSSEELIKKGEDPDDTGGYFIINGTEKVLINIEDLASNQILVEQATTGTSKYTAKIFSESGSYKIPHTLEKIKDGIYYFTFTRVRRIPAVLLMKALGMTKDEDIIKNINVPDPQDLYVNIYKYTGIKDVEEALDGIAKSIGINQAKEIRIQRVQEILDRFLLPHIGTEEKYRLDKAKNIAKIIKKHLLVETGALPEDDKDHYQNKRLKMSGDLLADLLRVNLKVLIGDMLYNFQRIVKRGKFPSIKVIIRDKLLTGRIYSSLATGNWVGGRKGISQRIQRINFLDTLSHLQRVVSPLSASQENFDARALHPTHLGRLCAVETPEGTNIGLRKNLSLLSKISLAANEKEIVEKLKGFGLKSGAQSAKGAEVYVNSKILGETDNPKSFIDSFKEERRKGKLPSDVSIKQDENEIHIATSKGRVTRPLIVVKNSKSLLTPKQVEQLEKNEITYSDLIIQGVIENLDAAEEENALVAFKEEELTSEHTHLDISPLAITGLVTSLVPFGNYNAPTRLNAGSKNQKQAIGFYAANYPVRMDMDVNLLHYPQVPIVQTITNSISQYEKHPSGQNVIVAIMSHDGYNMEDAIVLNQGSIDRGLARSTYFRPESVSELRYQGGLMDEISVPDKEVRGYRTEEDYKNLEGDGIISLESQVKEGDVIIGKTSPPRFLSSMDEFNLGQTQRRESSSAIKHGEGGTVDFVLISENEEGNKLVQVRIRSQKVPEIGDKFTSRHGQKGIVGMVVPPENMPFTANGITPDIMFNPHGIPSRMTMSHLIELLGGKVGALSGRYINGTTFDCEKEEDLRKELLSLGFRDDGTETMYNGQTGEILKAKIYIGNMYYLKLKHLVSNKMHSRARGPIQLLTRQPTEGRAKEGGLRLGEMEKDTFVAHGASLLLKDRFDADKTVVPVCEACGLIAVHDEFKNKSYCSVCEDSKVSNVEIAYAFKLFLDEIKSLGVYPKLTLKDKY